MSRLGKILFLMVKYTFCFLISLLGILGVTIAPDAPGLPVIILVTVVSLLAFLSGIALAVAVYTGDA